jgi:hypothetical protein
MMKSPCCQNPDNMQRQLMGGGQAIDTCVLCGRRHFIMLAEPGILGTYFGPRSLANSI